MGEGLSYPLATLAMLRQKPVEAAITIDGAPCPIGAFTVVLVNSTSYAGNFCVFPRASLDDAFFHILVANPGPFRQLRYNMSLLAKTYRGRSRFADAGDGLPHRAGKGYDRFYGRR